MVYHRVHALYRQDSLFLSLFLVFFSSPPIYVINNNYTHKRAHRTFRIVLYGCFFPYFFSLLFVGAQDRQKVNVAPRRLPPSSYMSYILSRIVYILLSPPFQYLISDTFCSAATPHKNLYTVGLYLIPTYARVSTYLYVIYNTSENEK